jgi:hypothetical protein
MEAQEFEIVQKVQNALFTCGSKATSFDSQDITRPTIYNRIITMWKLRSVKLINVI